MTDTLTVVKKVLIGLFLGLFVFTGYTTYYHYFLEPRLRVTEINSKTVPSIVDSTGVDPKTAKDILNEIKVVEKKVPVYTEVIKYIDNSAMSLASQQKADLLLKNKVEGPNSELTWNYYGVNLDKRKNEIAVVLKTRSVDLSYRNKRTILEVSYDHSGSNKGKMDFGVGYAVSQW